MTENPAILLGIDAGTKRIGVAKSDGLGVMAHFLPAIPGEDQDRAVRQIIELAREENVSKIIVGLPRNMNGSLGPSAAFVKKFGEKLAGESGIPVEYWDERLSTRQAERILIEEGDVSRKKRKTKIDSLAAQIILQSYLDAKKFQQ